jgi:F420-non-reducing hydrogenase iron-sulfur subunit
MTVFEPRIVGFLCGWCAYEGADAAGRARKTYPAHLRIVRVLCSGRVDPQFVLEAFRQGADGVMILGCHPGECHYKEGNLQALKMTAILKKLLGQCGIQEERLRLDWVAAGEYGKLVKIVGEMVEKVKSLGPLRLREDGGGINSALTRH